MFCFCTRYLTRSTLALLAMGILATIALTVAAQSPPRIRVGGDVREPIKLKDVRPVYPPEAKAAGVQGLVVLEILIDTKGLVRQAEVIKSVPLLDAAAHQAVLQWEYVPTRLNGEPVELVMTVTVNFVLSPQ
jgi:periplasmic protein TonB